MSMVAALNSSGFNDLVVNIKYNKDIVAFFKTIHGRVFNSDDKTWVFPINKYNCINNGLENFGVTIIENLTEEQIKGVVVIIVEEDEDFMYLKFPYNVEVNKILKNNNGTFLRERYIWKLSVSAKDQLYSDMYKEGINIKHYIDKPKSNHYYRTAILK